MKAVLKRAVIALKRSKEYREVRSRWKARFQTMYAKNPKYSEAADRDLEERHNSYWKRTGRPVYLDTLRVCSGISGHADYRIVPEEIFVTVIEPKLCPRLEAHFLAHKSTYNIWFPNSGFPRSYIHNVAGLLYDSSFQAISEEDARAILKDIPYPVVLKPNCDTYGGMDINYIASFESLWDAVAGRSDFVVQECMNQHSFFRAFNDCGLNTLRVCLYRSHITEKTDVLNIALRMGVGGSLDNEAAGGILTYVFGDGRLNNYAVDKYGTRYDKHPDSKIYFAESDRVPNIQHLRDVAIATAERIPFSRLVSLDMFLDDGGSWRVLEVNLFGQSIRQSQYAGHPFFGEFTDEVMDLVC